MKVALLGDIHGNYRALDIVLNKIKLLNINTLIITGDLIGYYYHPYKVIELLNKWNCYIVRGNHEVMLKDVHDNKAFLEKVDKKYGYGLRMAIEQLDKEQINLLCNLPHPLNIEIDCSKILLCHGSPWDLNTYIYPDSPIELIKKCSLGNYDLVVMGHTHIPMNVKIKNTILVNPGSLGQPRNNIIGASWATYDTISKEVELFNDNYDVTEIINECKKNNPDMPYLSEFFIKK